MRRLLLAAAGFATLLAPLAAVPLAAAHHRAEPPTVVTLVGTIQDELGCPTDWAPDCAESALAAREDGSWELVREVPAGA